MKFNIGVNDYKWIMTIVQLGLAAKLLCFTVCKSLAPLTICTLK